MQLTLELEEEHLPIVVKALRNECDRKREYRPDGTQDILARAADQIERQMRKPVTSEVRIVAKRKRG